MALRNVGILEEHYTASESKRPQIEPIRNLFSVTWILFLIDSTVNIDYC